MKKEKSCGAVVYKFENNEIYILLLKHIKGHFSFPKGHVEENETEIQTAIREIKEETNLDVLIDSNFRYINTYSPKENTIKDVIYFVATPKNNDVLPQLSEIEKIEWIKSDGAYDIITYLDDKILLKEALKYILKSKN